jgi:hypothetical protein
VAVAPAGLSYTQVGAFLPPANPQGLSDEETATINSLSSRLQFQLPMMQLTNAYYEGTQRLYDLGVTIPAALSRIRTVVDWPRICIDPLVQRAVVDGFRLPDSTDVDTELADIWQANDLDAEAPLSYLDALVYGRGYQIVGQDDNGDPLVTVESPLNLSLAWDPRTRTTTAAYQAYQAEGVQRAVLYLPNVSIYMSREVQSSAWTVDDRDEHGFGEVCVVRFANRPRSADREGRSEITPAIRNITDSACRSLLGMEIAREVYSVPHRYVLGADESDYVNPDGTPKSALEMTMSKFVAFQRDEDGNLPQVGQFQAFDPSVFTKIIDEQAQLMAAASQFPPSYFGLTSTANPASADAIRVAHAGLENRAREVQNQFSDPQERVMRLAWRVANGGAPVPAGMKGLTTDWIDAATRTPAATGDFLFKMVQMGAIPATSDVTLKEAGFNAVQRAQLEQDRKLDVTASDLAELATSIQVKQARADLTVAADVSAAKTNKPAPSAEPPTVPGGGQ